MNISVSHPPQPPHPNTFFNESKYHTLGDPSSSYPTRSMGIRYRIGHAHGQIRVQIMERLRRNSFPYKNFPIIFSGSSLEMGQSSHPIFFFLHANQVPWTITRWTCLGREISDQMRSSNLKVVWSNRFIEFDEIGGVCRSSKMSPTTIVRSTCWLVRI